MLCSVEPEPPHQQSPISEFESPIWEFESPILEFESPMSEFENYKKQGVISITSNIK